MFDPLLLSRIQFALNISFHILFPTITIGLCWLLLFFRLKYTQTKDKIWEYAYQFWVKIFALSFALGVVSGLTMSFQFGTNWPGFMEFSGNISGPLLGYEVLTAFFLEATFLGIMLFGKNRVSNKMHLVATFLVAFGTTLSAFWILSLNSWMHTPVGFEIIDGKIHPTDWFAVVFNPSFPYRLTHMVLAALLTACFLVAGVSAFRMRHNVDGPGTFLLLKTSIFLAAILIPIQIFVGDLHGLNTLQHQPAKVAAMEGIWNAEKGAGLRIIGIPSEKNQTTYAITIPYAASLILTHELEGEVKGVNDFDTSPPVAPVFYAFRVMLAIGFLMLIISWWVSFSLLRGKVLSPIMLRSLSWMTYSGWIATLSGWFVTEIGRQPWMIQDVLLVADVVADHSQATLVGTLLGYGVVYSFLLVAYIMTVRYMATKPAQSLSIVK